MGHLKAFVGMAAVDIAPSATNQKRTEGHSMWTDIPPPRIVLPPEYTPVGKCEDVCCSTCKTACIKPEECSNCDHVPPPLLRFNYSTRDGEFDPKNSIATYQTTTNSFHGREPQMAIKESEDPEKMRTPRFLEMSPISLRMLDQRP
ncbi:uncharacterized protein CEXT_8261 [Caerostris extrusa]|uniref:Uncharacterized protein n=1 Tax=Caerostris extrusa TaxID=172846 RepID=A0AAV4W7N2_CAEEX|nr:uncharacterized protein CEXT_8261 [Caerostris extrusa]